LELEFLALEEDVVEAQVLAVKTEGMRSPFCTRRAMFTARAQASPAAQDFLDMVLGA